MRAAVTAPAGHRLRYSSRKKAKEYYNLNNSHNRAIELASIDERVINPEYFHSSRPVIAWMILTTKIIIIMRIIWAVSQLAMFDKNLAVSSAAIVCDELSIGDSL